METLTAEHGLGNLAICHACEADNTRKANILGERGFLLHQLECHTCGQQALVVVPETGELYAYDDNTYLRPATRAEAIASCAAARHDGGRGIITIDGRRCYVQ